jgi:hypothetical protein
LAEVIFQMPQQEERDVRKPRARSRVVLPEDSERVWNGVDLLAQNERLSNLAEHNDAERRKTIPNDVQEIRALAGGTNYDARANAAFEGFADALSDVGTLSQPMTKAEEQQRRRPIRRYDKAVMRLISLGLDSAPVVDGYCKAWIRSKRVTGDKEALRWAKQGLEKGVKRPYSSEDLAVFKAVKASIVRQPSGRVHWGTVWKDTEQDTGRKFGTLENFNKGVVRHLRDLLAELPPRASRRKPRR